MRVNFAFFGANRIGGNASKEALAADVSRARLLKNAPTLQTKKAQFIVVLAPEPAPTVRNCIIVSVVHICVVSGH